MNKYFQKKRISLQRWWQGKIWQKRRAPNLLFPVRNEVTGNTVWFETNVTAYGLYVTIHQKKPGIKSIEDRSPLTAMAGVHIDFFVGNEEEKETQEQIKVQLFDETVGGYGDPCWQIPTEYSPRFKGASLLLVRDVQSWQPSLEAALTSISMRPR